MPGRRAFLQRVFGGAGAVTVLGLPDTRPPRAAQPKSTPHCPRCMNVFSLIVSQADDKDQLDVTTHCITYAPLAEIATPGKAWPVRCPCGWSGTAVFMEA